MVLSNKKLKQKLRTLLADSITTTAEPNKPIKDSSNPEAVSQELQSIKEILTTKNRKKPRTEKSKKRRKIESLDENSKGNEEEKGKKTKRDEFVDEELMERRRIKKEKKEKRNEMRKEKAKKMDDKRNRRRNESVDVEEMEEENVGKENKNIGAEKMVEKEVKFDQSENKKVYVGGIPYYSSEDDIRSFFEGCGTITEMDCMTFPETGKFRGIVFLTFKTEAAAKRALALDGADMGGFYLKIQPYKAKQQTQKSNFTPEVVAGYNRAYVGNLSWEITEDDLKILFHDCKISTIRFGTDKETGDFKGYAHVDFSDPVSLTLALKLDQQVVRGRPVRINRAVPLKKVVVPKTETDLDANSEKKIEVAKEEDGASRVGSKKKRRTCYECGVPGHLSSACPTKKAAAES